MGSWKTLCITVESARVSAVAMFVGAVVPGMLCGVLNWPETLFIFALLWIASENAVVCRSTRKKEAYGKWVLRRECERETGGRKGVREGEVERGDGRREDKLAESPCVEDLTLRFLSKTRSQAHEDNSRRSLHLKRAQERVRKGQQAEMKRMHRQIRKASTSSAASSVNMERTSSWNRILSGKRSTPHNRRGRQPQSNRIDDMILTRSETGNKNGDEDELFKHFYETVSRLCFERRESSTTIFASFHSQAFGCKPYSYNAGGFRPYQALAD